MPDKIVIEATDDTPMIHLDKEKGVFIMEGKSLPENAGKFYEPIKDWFAEYCKNPNTSTNVKCKLDYFNSSSAKRLLEIFALLQSIADKNTKITWYYAEGDTLMQGKGEEMDYLLDVDFDIKPIDKNSSLLE